MHLALIAIWPLVTQPLDSYGHLIYAYIPSEQTTIGIREAGWVADLTEDGDVEPHPGPTGKPSPPLYHEGRPPHDQANLIL
jgi:hypothetical protein